MCAKRPIFVSYCFYFVTVLFQFKIFIPIRMVSPKTAIRAPRSFRRNRHQDELLRQPQGSGKVSPKFLR
jgi:hypothetical protein